MADLTMDTLVSLCKRRGFIFPSSEIYGGLASAWDYGPMGVELKKRIQEFWWRGMTQLHDNIVGLDAAIMMHPRVWEASGHVENFTDPLIDCRQCKHRFRADQIPEENLRTKKCPDCGANALTEARKFNLMFTTHMGPVEAEGGLIYLRPETAQGIYVNFKNVLQTGRVKIPFGIAQVGKAFRNEITTKNYIFRTCEFEQMEMQYFVHPSEDLRWFEHWKEKRFQYYLDLGVRKAKLRFHQHGPGELAHYAKLAFDIEYEFPFGWNEFEGIHDRTDFDLSRHQQTSGKKLEYFDQERGERYLPFVVETSVGADRTALAVLCDAYHEEAVAGETRVVLRFLPAIAPIKAAVLPLVNREGMPEIAKRIHDDLRGRFTVFFDDGGSIGRRYRRQDEAGTPFAITVDGQTTQDGTVTVRHRDTLAQDRIDASAVTAYLAERLAS